MMKTVIGVGLLLIALPGCSTCGGGESTTEPTAPSGGDDGDGGSQAAETPPAAEPSGKALLVAQSTFVRSDTGRWSTPDDAKLLILRPSGTRWEREEITDSESNVFHKATFLGDGEETSILTIGGNKAALKLWRRDGDGWTAKTLWQPTFGGAQNRLRDVELGDVDGDGTEDIVIATHDQGITAVVRRGESGWEPTELDRTENTFVHEIELGDVDGDGRLEIYATPSRPNLGGGGAQPGKVTRYAWNGESFDREVVAEYERRHAKEILVADLSGDGRPEVYAALEAETEASGGLGGRVVHPVEIRRYTRGESGWTSEVVATINDRQCRFLVAGDFDGDDSPELIAAAMTSGVWMWNPGDSLPWTGMNLESDTAGFEHAALLADIDGNGALELYIADDRHGRVVRYLWNADSNGVGEPEVLVTRTVPQSAMTWNLWVGDLP